MRVLVVGGAGAMGRWTVRDLTESEGVDEVVVADLDGARAQGGGRLGGGQVRWARLDRIRNTMNIILAVTYCTVTINYESYETV